MTDIGYYPGCALQGSSNDYEASVRASLNAFNVNLNEIDDWICCGASAAHSLNHKLSVALPARNLALSEKHGFDKLLAPCPMCSMELIKANRALAASPDLCKEMSDIVEQKVTGRTRILNLIQLFQEIGIPALKAAVKKPLDGVTAACYYGCLLTRPADILAFDDCEHPASMETILAALGAKTVAWNFQTECCGAGMTMANEDTVLNLSHKILSNAAAHGANCIVVACPMCHVNLDMKQEAIDRCHGVHHDMEVFYLSDLVGLALGIDRTTLGIDRHFVVKNEKSACRM